MIPVLVVRWFCRAVSGSALIGNGLQGLLIWYVSHLLAVEAILLQLFCTAGVSLRCECVSLRGFALQDEVESLP